MTRLRIAKFLAWLAVKVSGLPAVQIESVPYLGERSPKWRKVREEFLKEFPTCACCGGDRDLNVHHKKPFHLFPNLELDPKNLITLCEKHGCHFLIGHLCDWRSYNPNVVADAGHIRASIQNRPEASGPK